DFVAHVGEQFSFLPAGSFRLYFGHGDLLLAALDPEGENPRPDAKDASDQTGHTRPEQLLPRVQTVARSKVLAHIPYFCGPLADVVHHLLAFVRHHRVRGGLETL